MNAPQRKGTSWRNLDRRTFLRALGGAVFAGMSSRISGATAGDDATGKAAAAARTKAIPATGERIPVVGMGSYITFNVGPDTQLRDDRTKVLETFFARGGGMIDSSPMYGSSEEVIGYGLKRVSDSASLFSATKVWTRLNSQGPVQIADSLRLWGIPRFDLFQVHNLLNWKDHLKTLREHRERGVVRYIGVTTSHGRRHEELEAVMRSEPIDFVQLTYNILDRDVEARLLPLARERGIAVIANRPFQGGRLFDRFAHRPLPAWAAEIDVGNWAQFFLKFIVSHEAVTCAIPATSQVGHMEENMGALRGRLPDEKERRRMVDYVSG